MVRENRVTVDDLIQPLFVADEKGLKKPLGALPDNHVWGPDTIISEIEACMNLGINSFILFPKVDDRLKDKLGSYGYAKDNFYLSVASEIKSRFPECVLISDVAMDPYSSDGHDGLVMDGVIDNDDTLEILAQMSILQAEAGFDMLGPSDMMDGRVGYIREVLDDSGYKDVGIMSYTAKYASALYGPFRDALDSAPVQDPAVPTDKKTYQMDPANKQEAIREADGDIAEGADFLMVKPALHYLDIIDTLKRHSELPIAAYHVSGECAMLAASADKGYIDLQEGIKETLLCIKRAGADVILTYYAKAFAGF